MSQTSKPFSTLLQASFNPLFTNEIFSITVPIKVRCSPETDAFHNMSRNISGVPGSPEATPKAQSSFEGICSPASKITVGRGPDSPGPFYHRPRNPGWSEVHLRVLPLLSPGLKGPSAMTLQGHPPYWARRSEEASRSPSSLGGDSPKKRIAQKNSALTCKNAKMCYAYLW